MKMRSKLQALLLAGVSALAMGCATKGFQVPVQPTPVPVPSAPGLCGTVGDGVSFVGFTTDQQKTMIGYNNQLLNYQKANSLPQKCLFPPNASPYPANSSNLVLDQPYVFTETTEIGNGSTGYQQVPYGLAVSTEIQNPYQPNSFITDVYGVVTNAVILNSPGQDGSFGISIKVYPGDTHGHSVYYNPSTNYEGGAPASTDVYELGKEMAASNNSPTSKVYNQVPDPGLILDINNFVEFMKRSYGISPNPNNTYDPTSIVNLSYTGTGQSGICFADGYQICFPNLADPQAAGKRFITTGDNVGSTILFMREDDNMTATDGSFSGLIFYVRPAYSSHDRELLTYRPITIKNGNITLDQAGPQAMDWLNTIKNVYGQNYSFFAENHKPAKPFSQQGKHKGSIELAQLLLPTQAPGGKQIFVKSAPNPTSGTLALN